MNRHTLKNKLAVILKGISAKTNEKLITGLAGKEKSIRKIKQDRKQSHYGTIGRRELVKGLAGIPLFTIIPGVFKRDWTEFHTLSASDKSVIDQLKDSGLTLPAGKIGNLTISRMLLGCNLMGGWSHARDLIYTDALFKTYHTENKIIETLNLAEQSGINTCMMVTQYYQAFNKYKNTFNGKMQSICQAMLPQNDFLSDINLAIDSGATALYIQGGEGDKYVSSGRIDIIFKAIDHIKKQGLAAGMGAHSIETIRACEKEGVPVDFYVKTLHHDRYWSAHPAQNREEYSVIRDNSADHNKFHDNMWDLFPSKTIEFMKSVNKPWIAFKVLAAGAIHPKVGFRHAFENGADFIAVGMFDFQILDDVKIAGEILSGLSGRERAWF